MLSKGISEVSCGGEPASPLRLSPVLRVAAKVPGLLGSPVGPALNIPETLLVLSLPWYHETPFQGVPRRHKVSQHAMGKCCEMPHRGEYIAR